MNTRRTLFILRHTAEVVILAALAAVPATIAYQQQQPTSGKAEFPQTPEGKLARALFEAVNSGDKAAVEKFVTANLSTKALKEDGASEYITHIQRLYAQSGGFEL